MGVLPTSQRDVVIVVDSSAALSGLFPTLLKDYLQPCLEHFCGGGLAESSTGLQYGPVQYSLVVVHPSSVSYRPPCSFYPVTCSAPQVMKWLNNIKFEGGLVERNFHLSEALAAVLEVFTLMESTVDPFLSPDVDIQKQCLLVMGFPPSPHPCVESIQYIGKDAEQLVKLIVQRNISLSIVSPRRLHPFLSLFEKALLATPTSGSPGKKAESDEGGMDGAAEGSGEPTTVGGVIKKADHSLQKDHLVLLQGFEIQALKAQRKAKEPTSQQQGPPVPIGVAPSDQHQQVDIKPSLADFKPPSVASLASLGIDQSNPSSVLSTTSSGDTVAMEMGQPLLSVKQEFMDTTSASIAMVTTGGMQNAVSANLDSKLAPSMESGSMLGLKRSASPQTSGPGSVGPPSTKSIKLEDDTSSNSLTANISQTNTSQPQQSFSAGQSLAGPAGLSFSGPPVALSGTATAQVIASSIGGGNPLGGVTMTTQQVGGGVVGRVLGNILTASGSAGNPIQIGSPVTGPSMTFPTSMAQQSLASSASTTLPSSSLASSLFATSQQSQMQGGGGAASQLGQLQTAGNLQASSVQQQQQQALASSAAQNQPMGSSISSNPSVSNPIASMGSQQQQQQQPGGISSLYGTTAPKVGPMTSSYQQQGIPPQQQQQQQQQQQPIVSMANTSVSMYDQKAQQQPQAQFSQPGTQAQRQTNLDAARKFAEMAKQQAELQKAAQGVQQRSVPIGLQTPGSRPVIPGMAGVVMQQQQQQQQNVGGMGIGQGQGGMGMGQNQPGMTVLPGQQQQQQHQMGATGNVASASSSVGSMQQGGGGVTVTAFGGGQRVPTPPVASTYPTTSVTQPTQQQPPTQQQQQPGQTQQQLLSQQQQQQQQLQGQMMGGASQQMGGASQQMGGASQQMGGASQQMSLQQQQQQQVQGVQQQQQQLARVVWNGIMELTEVQDNKRQMRQVQCNVLTAKNDVIRELQPNQWPQRMNMNTYPKVLFNSITQMMNFQSGANNVKTVTFQFLENPQNVTMLRMLMTSEVKTFAIVQLVGVQQLSQCPIKALILVWNDRQKQFTGLVPLEQDKFINVLKQVLNAQRQRNLMLQQQAQQAQQGQQAGMQQQMSYQQQQPGQPGVSTGQALQAHQQQQQGMAMPGQQGGAAVPGGGGGVVGGAPVQTMAQQQQQQQAQAVNQPNPTPGMGGMTQQQHLQQMQQQQSQQQQQQQLQGQGMGGAGPQQVGQMSQGQQQMHGQMGGVSQPGQQMGGVSQPGQQMAQQQQQQGQMMQQGQQTAGGMMGQPPQGGQQQMDAKLAQVQQFIRGLAFATPQQQEQLLQRVPPAKRAQVLMRAQQLRQQIQQQQQQQQQQQSYNPGGGGGIMGTGGIQPNLPQSSQPGMNMTGQIPTAVSGMQQQQRPPGMGGMQMQGMMNVPRPGMPPQQQMPPGSGGYWQTQ